jgi:hypothetical protein
LSGLIPPIVAFFLFASQPPRYGSSFSRIDPQQVSLNYTHVEHVAGSLLLTHLAGYGLRKLGLSERKTRFLAPSIAFAVGSAKEAWDATQWRDRGGEGWDSTDLLADLVGVGLGQATYDRPFVDAFALPAFLVPLLYETTDDRASATLLAASYSLCMQPPAREDRTSRLLGIAGGTVAGSLSTRLEPRWTFDRASWAERRR